MQIEIPSKCPSCGSDLEATELELFCRNSELCPAQNLKRIEHFCKIMKIKGMGPARIETLVNSGHISNIFSLYLLTKEQLVSILGSSIGTTLHSNIQSSKQTEEATLLYALGIPKVGKVAAERIINQVGSLRNLSNLQTEKGLVGTVVLEAINSWLRTKEFDILVSIDWQFTENKVKAQSDKQEVICITGKLNDFANRKSAEQYLNSLGYQTKASVTKDVTVLICEDETKTSSSSYKKALEKGITITTIKNLLSSLEG